MPSEAQDAYWSCDFCGMEGFPTFEEAKAHELEQCQRKRRPGVSIENTNPTGNPYSAGMGPLSAAVAAEMSGQTGAYGTRQQTSPQQQRRFPLLRTGEDQHQSSLSIENAVECENIEVFEAAPDNVAEYNSSPAAAEGAIVVGQVGIRCIHCARSSSPSAVAFNTVFPRSVDAIGSSLQMLGGRHLAQCRMAPPNVQDVIVQAIQTRQQQPESPEEERKRTTALIEYCTNLCQRNGIINNRDPYKTGLVFSDNKLREQQPQGGGAEQRADTSSTRAAAAPGADTPGAPNPGPLTMMHPDNTAGGGTITATPLMSRNKQDQAQQQRHPYEQQQGTTPGGYSSLPYNPHGGSEGMYGQEQGAMGAPINTPGTRSEGEQPTPHGAYQGYPMQNPSPYDMQPQSPSNFPFFQDQTGSWNCRYCSTIHPQYREPGSVWSSHGPPPAHVIDQHLSRCRAYNQAAMQQPMPPPQHGWGGGPPPSQQYPPAYPPQHGYGSQPPPPGWGTPGGGGGGQSGMMSSTNPMHPQQQHAHYSPTQSGPSGPPPEHSYHFPPPHQHDAHHGGVMPPPSHPESHGGGGHPGLLPTTPRAPTGGASSRGGGGGPVPARPDGSDAAARAAIDHLVVCDRQYSAMEPTAIEDMLVLEEDKLLLTDYFYYLMKQLRLCRFFEADRKTRGGKRENILVGYGGLQCIHCAEAPNSRKFFWSNVDRLANSFAEIPGHVLKCRRCPNQTKTSLLELKTHHSEQMARLPRGSQKVFFRRMWRRLHDKDPQPQQQSTPEEVKQASSGETEHDSGSEMRTPAASKSDHSKSEAETAGEGGSHSSPGTSSSESTVLVQRSTEEAAKALAASVTTQTAPPSPSSRILLAITEDKEWLSDMDCFIRRNLEVFCATEEDVATAQSDRKYPVNLGQVGIRCIHCSLSKDGEGARGTAVSFPYSISGIYESVREFQRLHLESCPNLPPSIKSKLSGFKGSSSLSSVLRKYYVLAAKALGMYDTPDGIRSGAESVPLGSSAAFAFSDSSSRVSEQMRAGDSATAGGSSFLDSSTGPAITPLESRKRKNVPLSAEDASSEDSSKKRLQKEEV